MGPRSVGGSAPECAPVMLASQRVQVIGVQFFAAVADDLVARQVEHVDAPVQFRGEQIGCHREQLIRTAIGPFGDASARADVPIAVGVAMHRQNGFALVAHRLSLIQPMFPNPDFTICRRNSQNDVGGAIWGSHQPGSCLSILKRAALASISNLPAQINCIHRAVSKAPPNAKKCGATICAATGVLTTSSRCRSGVVANSGARAAAPTLRIRPRSDAPTPHWMAKCSSFAIGAGPAIPKRTGSRICRCASSRSHALKAPALSPNCVTICIRKPERAANACLARRASQSTVVGTALWPSGCPATPI